MKIENVKVGMMVEIKKSFDLYQYFYRYGKVTRILPGSGVEVILDGGCRVAVPICKLKRLKGSTVTIKSFLKAWDNAKKWSGK